MIVVADTSVLINLARIDRLELLRRLFGTVVVPAAVAREFLRLSNREPRFAGLQLPEWLEMRVLTGPSPLASGLDQLDAGESEAIALALEIAATAVLLDERRGCAVARALGLQVVGTVGVLLRAKQSGDLAAVGPELDRLTKEAGFWISATVRSRVLELAGEASA